MNELANRAAAVFRERFRSEPMVYFSPGRINLIGEHIDYNDGFVMPAAIDRGVYYAIAPNDSGMINFYAADFNESYSTKINAVDKNSGWKNYVLSVVNEFLNLDKKITGFNCVFGGDIPRGSGMSSSAAVEGGIAFALNEFFEYRLSRKELALLNQRAEHNYPNVKCGIMDQYANMLGRKDHVLLLDCRSIEHEYFPLKLGDYKIVLLNSKVHHSLASGEYNVRRKQCEEGLAIMSKDSGIRSFRDIKNPEAIFVYKDKMSEEVYMRCLYVVQEIDRTQKAAAFLQQNDLTEFGKLMYASHEGLSKLYNVSCKELDFLAELAKQNPDVIGARMMGGGFGGCTINIVKEKSVDQFIEQATRVYKEKFQITPEAYVVNTDDGVSRLV